MRPPSRREKEILIWAARGKTMDVIGEIMGIKGCSVHSHYTMVRIKLNASNITHAVAKALALGVINKEDILYHDRPETK